MESYDDAGGVYSTLKTDIITINVAEKAVEVLQTEWLSESVSKTWTLQLTSQYDASSITDIDVTPSDLE